MYHKAADLRALLLIPLQCRIGQRRCWSRKPCDQFDRGSAAEGTVSAFDLALPMAQTSGLGHSSPASDARSGKVSALPGDPYVGATYAWTGGTTSDHDLTFMPAAHFPARPDAIIAEWINAFHDAETCRRLTSSASA